MASTIDDFWKLFQEVQGTSTDLTDSVKAIAKNEKTVSEKLFSNIIDQVAYNSNDYQRIRSFLRDWYAAHRSLTSFQANVSDIYQMPNDQLDELFQSFGYNLSASLRDPITNNPPLNKVNFFLDLVNLYKIKGSPKALIDVLQYYGIVDVDLYEMSLQFDDRASKNLDDLIFKGRVITGTTGDQSPIYLPFNLLTQNDPHWLQSESQIRSLFNTNKINFPSQSPYFAVKPLFDEEATDAATGILQRKVQDQYSDWELAGFPVESTTPYLPQNAVISITGDECSLLTLYLANIYVFNKEYHVGQPADRFICYDGTNTTSTDIIDEFRTITSKPSSRLDQKTKYTQYLDTFSRDITLNFLQTSSDAGSILQIINPQIKSNLDNLASDNNTTLGSLLRDLGEWVRSNISYGFINMSYILFGIDALFSQLRDVVEFFKPYRARIVPLELVQFRNRLINSMVVEDSFSHNADISIYDYLVGDSAPCCSDSTCSSLVHPRDYYDCGSYYDIGAVTDIPENLKIHIHDTYYDYMKCPTADATTDPHFYVHSDIISGNYILPQTTTCEIDSSTVISFFNKPRDNNGYALTVNVINEIDTSPSIMPFIVTNKNTSEFELEFSDKFDSENYIISWTVSDSTNNTGIQPIPDGTNEISILFDTPRDSTNYAVAITLENSIDTVLSFFLYTITEKTVNGFTVTFSDNMPTANYSLAWTTETYGRVTTSGNYDGWYPIPDNSDTVTVPFYAPYEIYNNYVVAVSIVNTTDPNPSQYAFYIRLKEIYGFTLNLSSPTDSANYFVSWSMVIASDNIFDSLLYRQFGQFRNFDDEGSFDCTYGFDQIDIEVEDLVNNLLQETGDYLLLEDGNRILL